MCLLVVSVICTVYEKCRGSTEAACGMYRAQNVVLYTTARRFLSCEFSGCVY